MSTKDTIGNLLSNDKEKLLAPKLEYSDGMDNELRDILAAIKKARIVKTSNYSGKGEHYTIHDWHSLILINDEYLFTHGSTTIKTGICKVFADAVRARATEYTEQVRLTELQYFIDQVTKPRN
jgi:hypothetical protein